MLVGGKVVSCKPARVAGGVPDSSMTKAQAQAFLSGIAGEMADWQVGMGTGESITNPEGSIINGEHGDYPTQDSAPDFSDMTRILVLSNMVTLQDLADEDEYNDIVADIRAECSKYGTVVHILIPRPNESKHTDPDDIGKVFVEYLDLESVQRATIAISGRKFSSRTIGTSYLSEDEWAQKAPLR